VAALLVVRSPYRVGTNFKPATKAAKSAPGRWGRQKGGETAGWQTEQEDAGSIPSRSGGYS